jgi:hypothetical protein
MLKQTLAVLVGFVPLTSLVPSSASAEPMLESLGVRVGGYGFREATPASGEEPHGTGWQACRMNGLGVFAIKGIDENFFVEAGLDTYFSDSFPTGESMGTYDTPIDRSSALLTMAAGARFYTDSLISPYIQLGLGAELTHVRLPALAMEDTALLPMAFFGTGATLRVSDRMRVGAVLRVHAMGYYDDAQFQTELKPELELATQGQFYASFLL